MNPNLTFSEYCCAHVPVAARFAGAANYCSSFCGLIFKWIQGDAHDVRIVDDH